MLDKMCVFSFFQKTETRFTSFKCHVERRKCSQKQKLSEKGKPHCSMMRFACAFSENTTGRSSATLIAGTLGVSLARKC